MRRGECRVTSGESREKHNEKNHRPCSLRHVLGDELRLEYDLSKLKGGVRGKYYERTRTGTNLVLIEPDLANVFPDTDAVNRALRLLADTAEAAVGFTWRALWAPKKRLKRTTGKPAA